MRNTFANLVLEEMKENDNIYVIVGDVGYGVFDEAIYKFHNIVDSQKKTGT